MNISVMQAILAVVALAIVLSFFRAHHNKDIQFNVFDLIMENGKVSKISVLIMGSFFATTWVIIDMEIGNRLTEGYLTIYCATWIAPTLVRFGVTKTDPPKAQ